MSIRATGKSFNFFLVISDRARYRLELAGLARNKFIDSLDEVFKTAGLRNRCYVYRIFLSSISRGFHSSVEGVEPINRKIV